MKKKYTSMFALLLTGSLILAACGEGDDNGNDVNNAGGNNNAEENEANDNDGGNDNAAADTDVGNLQLGTGSTGGTYYPLGQEMATVINNNIEVDGFDLSAVSSGASVDNIVSIFQGEMDLGMTVHLPALDSLTGDGDFEGVAVDNFGFMGHIYPEVMQIVTGADSDIESIADLEGKSVAIGPPGSGTQAAAKLILEAYGLEDGDYDAYEEGFGDAAGRIQDGNLDASFGLLGLPAGSIEELSISRDIRLLPISDEGLDYIEENSGYEELTIPADSYDFLDEDIQAVTAYAILVGSTDTIDEDLGYEITKALFEHSGDISHPQGDHLTKENALNGSEGLPMHPGAERYFDEEGITE
ncbi:TAXI family TRAP transporter solute-binding subunit [Salipaludibacillus sp. CUR1]|uniref:TAXI family TRAP transporter solute-binding subunit n=1 Tax=Salipaludibacillus sp. CUR1 TaxID=2820003 RepID=UPI001E53DD08|nr:TAXI family TRAP transporter solute-binding subunit [Salipaludibacillus sp. CUR1]MCE7793562.1 TAXI family TRAP transporter solute-binding subunit [Salipaludibacillus sp. CUR1]